MIASQKSMVRPLGPQLARLSFVALVASLALTQSCSCEQTCVASSECSEGACVEGVCDPAVEACSLCGDNQACSAEGDCEASCTGGFVWDGSACALPEGCADCETQNRSCNAADETCGGCATGYQEWQGNCVPTMTCDPAPAEDSLLAACEDLGRECQVTADGAICGECLADYTETGESCEEQRSCTDATLSAECATANRSCVEEPNGHCDVCLPGFIEEDQGGVLVCRAVITCAEITCDTACTDATETTDAFCAESCTGPNGQDGVTNAAGNCVECGACDAASQDGPYLVSLYAGTTCVCKSAPGYYYDPALSETTPCDVDNDGWTRSSAQLAYDSPNQVLQATFQCDVREVSSIELRSHDGLTKTIALDEPAPLFEEVRIDSQTGLDLVEGLAPYGGRELKAEELNSLTKACVSSGSDYNLNGIEDVDEAQGMNPANSIHVPFIPFTYFIELYRGYYENGRYIIEEKSRAIDAVDGKALPLTTPDGEGSFWRGCSVFEDPGYESDVNDLGKTATTYDFAQYADDTFLLGHHSQFKCLRVVADSVPVADRQPHQVVLADLEGVGPGAEWYVNDCAAQGTDDAPISDPPLGDPRNPKDPVIGCTARPSDTQDSGLGSNDVFWAVRRYLDYNKNGDADMYAGGCVNECAEFKDRCPGYDPAVPTKTKCDGTIGDFGKLVCGCDYNYGGPSCDFGCPDTNLLYQADIDGVQEPYTLAPRAGYWMCGGITASSNAELVEPIDAGPGPDGGEAPAVGYRLRGAVPATVTPTTRLCQADVDAGPGGEPCSVGWSIGPSVLP